MTGKKELIVSPVYNDRGNIVGQEYHGELIRCKDCKHWQKSSINYNEYVCYWGGYVKQEDDYCSCAERKEHETD